MGSCASKALRSWSLSSTAGIGDLGDIVLADWSQYKLATIGGVESASVHARAIPDQPDGLPLHPARRRPTDLAEYLTPYKGTANTMSPFIMLEAR